jgi:hypothetical protein
LQQGEIAQAESLPHKSARPMQSHSLHLLKNCLQQQKKCITVALDHALLPVRDSYSQQHAVLGVGTSLHLPLVSLCGLVQHSFIIKDIQ